MTPDAVIFRYLQTLLAQEVEVEQLCQLISADADLLQRWLKMFNLDTDSHDLLVALQTLGEDDLRSLAHVQAWSLVPSAGSARLSLDLWRSVLHSAYLAEALYAALKPQTAIDELANVRLRALLGLSGVQLQHDERLMELHEFRGIDPALLEDAHVELRIFAVADGVETGREEALANLLLDIDEESLAALQAECHVKADALMVDLAINGEDATDWSHNIWLLQQASIAGQALSHSETLEGLWAKHTSVSKSLFSTPPLVLVLDAEKASYQTLPTGDIAVPTTSATSVIAAVAASKQSRVIDDNPSLAVVDRQLLRSMQVTEAIVACANNVVMLFDAEEDLNITLAAELYTHELARNLPEAKQPQALEQADETRLERYRDAEHQRLKELVHEANNPLSIVRNYLHILDLTLGQDPETKDQLQLISNELRRASEIISQVRDLPPIVAEEPDHTLPVTETMVDLELTVWLKNLVQLHSGLAEQHQVFLSANAPGGPVRHLVNDDKLTQIVSNLAKNAIEASAPGRKVAVHLQWPVFRLRQRGAEISIVDHAGGLPNAVLEALGGEQDSSKGGEHQGLGLKIALELSEEIAAEMDIVRTDTGTTFRIFLASDD